MTFFAVIVHGVQGLTFPTPTTSTRTTTSGTTTSGTTTGAPKDGHFCYFFPEHNTNAHVVITPLHDEEISDFVVDMQLQFIKMTLDPFYLSVYSTRDNEFLIGNRAVYIAQKEFALPSIKSAIILGKYHRLTITRKGNKLRMYLDGTLKAERRVTTLKIPKGANWILGQEQDTRGGGFVRAQRLIGNICDFRMWNVGLTKEEAPDFFRNFLTFGTTHYSYFYSYSPSLFDSPSSYKFVLNTASYFHVDVLKTTIDGMN